MSRKHVLAASLLLPLIALSNVAQASPQGSDRAWWPSNARNYSSSDAYITKPVAARTPIVAPRPSGQTCRYQGGPRSPLVCTTQP